MCPRHGIVTSRLKRKEIVRKKTAPESTPMADREHPRPLPLSAHARGGVRPCEHSGHEPAR